LESKQEDKRCCNKREQIFPEFSLFLISKWIWFWFYWDVSKYLKYTTLSDYLLPVFMLWLEYILSFSAFTFRPISLLVANKLLWFSLQYVCFHQWQLMGFLCGRAGAWILMRMLITAFLSAQPLNYLCVAYIAGLNFLT
jgi:hypothetical protein